MLMCMFRFTERTILKNLRTQTLKVPTNIELFLYKKEFSASDVGHQKLKKEKIVITHIYFIIYKYVLIKSDHTYFFFI